MSVEGIRPLRAIAQGLRFCLCAAAEFRRHGCASLAASLAFFSLLSLFPLVFLLLYGIGVLVSQEVIGEQFLFTFLKAFLPSLGRGLAEELHRVSEVETVRWVVILAFAWFGALVFYELDYAINVVFGSSWRRHPLISTAIAVALLGTMGMLLILSYVATETVELLTQYAPRFFGIDLAALTAHDVLLTYTVPFSLAFLTVTGLYHYVPPDRPTWREAAIGALVFGLLWVAAKHLFIAYSQYATLYARIYGSLLEVVLLLLWVYYSSALLLFGAIVTRQLHLRDAPAASP